MSVAAVRAASEPPADLAKRVAERESAALAERGHYLYNQSVTVEEFDSRGGIAGIYREAREVIFTPEGERIERSVGKPVQRLKTSRPDRRGFPRYSRYSARALYQRKSLELREQIPW